MYVVCFSSFVCMLCLQGDVDGAAAITSGGEEMLREVEAQVCSATVSVLQPAHIYGCG